MFGILDRYIGRVIFMSILLCELTLVGLALVTLIGMGIRLDQWRAWLAGVIFAARVISAQPTAGTSALVAASTAVMVFSISFSSEHPAHVDEMAVHGGRCGHGG